MIIIDEEYNHIKRTNEYSIAHTGYIYDGIPLEQIRDEIEDCKQYQFETYGIQRYFKINDIWQIIDKYKGE